MNRIIQRDLRCAPDAAFSGEGTRPRLADGREVRDGAGGVAVACLGYGNRRVAAAIARQTGRHAYAHGSFFTSEPAERLARGLGVYSATGTMDGVRGARVIVSLADIAIRSDLGEIVERLVTAVQSALAADGSMRKGRPMRRNGP